MKKYNLRNWKSYLRIIMRKIICFPKSSTFKNKTVSVICNNCVGGIYCHDLKIKFNSPFVNLNIAQEDFPFLVKHLKEYMNLDIAELMSNKSYPVGVFVTNNISLRPIVIEFIHYKSFEEALKKWNERRCRINYENIRVILDITSRPDLENCNFKDFCELPYKKVILTGGEAGTCKYKIDFKDRPFNVGRILEFYSFAKRFSDKFNYKKFLS